MREVAALLLAAGEATRFGSGRQDTKLAAGFEGKALIRYVAEAALGSRADPISIVTGHAAGTVTALLAGLPVSSIHNPAYAEGLSTSLKAGIAALPRRVEGVVVLLADMPFITAEIIDRLIACFEEASSVPDAVVPVRQGRRGNPVLLGRSLFPEIAELRGDKGAGALLKQAGRHILDCPIEDEAIEIDVDTREMLAGLKHPPTG